LPQGWIALGDWSGAGAYRLMIHAHPVSAFCAWLYGARIGRAAWCPTP
jgi:hypothetical protein